MRAYEFIFEAAYDGMIAAIAKRHPEAAEVVSKNSQWAKQVLKKADRIVWYMNIVGAYLDDTKDLTKLRPLLGSYRFTDLEQLQHDFGHFYGLNSPKIESYTLAKQPVSGVLADLKSLEVEFQKTVDLAKPVPIQEGDYKLAEFADGTVWWYANRSFCPEEGRSGGHCGNVVGKDDPSQRILSLRNAKGQVILTFILHKNGNLGEMKAKNNQKPASKYHPHIVRLLTEFDKITGIVSGGYAPENNFSVYDLSEELYQVVRTTKPKLIFDNVKYWPTGIMNVPHMLRDRDVLKYAREMTPAIRSLVDADGNVSTTDEAWKAAIDTNRDLIIYAPVTSYTYTELLDALTPELLASAPAHISRNVPLLKQLVRDNSELFMAISPNLKGYRDIAIIAVATSGYLLDTVPEEFRDYETCLAAVTVSGMSLMSVPPKLRDYKLCMAAIDQDGWAVVYVPEELRDYKLCMAAVNQYGRTLAHVPREPKDLRDYEMCLAAVSNNAAAIEYVPEDLPEYDELAALANQ
jgi:hypothetical protein